MQRLLDRNIEVDTLTDQTSAHDELIGYFPEDMSVEDATKLRETNPEKYKEKLKELGWTLKHNKNGKSGYKIRIYQNQ